MTAVLVSEKYSPLDKVVKANNELYLVNVLKYSVY